MSRETEEGFQKSHKRRKNHRWTASQVEELVAFSKGTKSWNEVAQKVGGGITGQQCQSKYAQLVKSKTVDTRESIRKTWTTAQVEKLIAFSNTGTWEQVAQKVGDGFTGYQCQNKYGQLVKSKKVLPRFYKRKTWTTAQVEKLIAYLGDFENENKNWDEIAVQVGDGVSGEECKKKYAQLVQSIAQESKSHKTQVEKLVAFSKTGGTWAQVAEKVGDGITGEQCQNIYAQFFEKRKEKVSRKRTWSTAQVEKLVAFSKTGDPWAQVAEKVGDGFTGEQCKSKYAQLVKSKKIGPRKFLTNHHHHHHKIWTKAKVEKLVAFSKSTRNWNEIAVKVGDGVTGEQCKNKYFKMVRLNQGETSKRQKSVWTTAQVDALGRALMSMDESDFDIENHLKRGTWQKVASQIPGGNFTQDQCLKKFQYELSLGHFQDVVGKYPVLGFPKKKKSPSWQDAERLKAAVQANGRKWTLVAKQVGSTPMRCQSRYEKLVQQGVVGNPPAKRSQEAWTLEEKQAFNTYVEQVDAIDYDVLAQCVKTKTKLQCESRFNWLAGKGAFSKSILMKRPRAYKKARRS